MAYITVLLHIVFYVSVSLLFFLLSFLLLRWIYRGYCTEKNYTIRRGRCGREDTDCMERNRVLHDELCTQYYQPRWSLV